jgi:iron complex outermembrane receptor protein
MTKMIERATARRAGVCAAALMTAMTGLMAKPTLAQDAEPEATAVDEIVVTARRRTERLQDVPVAVTALTSESLETLQATDIGDIQGAVPNLTLHTGDASNAVVYIRGVGQVDSLAFADPGVGIYVDDVYLGRAQGAFLSVYDVDRIEVLRGPQGTLYGRNTIGGAIKFVSTPLRPELNGRIEASVGDYDLREVRGAVGGAIGEGLLAKAAISYASREGYGQNAFDGRSDGDKDQLAGRLAFEYRPSDTFSLRLNIDASRDRPDTSRTPARATSVFGLYPATTSDPFAVDADFNDLADLDTFGVSLTGEWAMSDSLTVKSITAYRSIDYSSHLDLDATPLPFFGIYDDETQSQVSQEIQLAYDGGGRLNWVGGLFYFAEEDSTFAGLFGPAITVVTAELNEYENRSFAAYGQGSYDLTERLSLTAGLRYTYEEKDFFRTQDLIIGATTVPERGDTGFQLVQIDTSSDWSSLSPKIGLDYRASPDLLIYASASRGFKSGGFDGRAATQGAAAPYDPETLWAYEAGIKSSLFDRRLTANVAAFWNDYTDLQLSSFVADPGGVGGFGALFTNAGAATIRGVEVEVVARPTSALTLNGTLAYLDGQYDEYIGPGGLDISDQRELVNAPEWSGRLGAVYAFELGANGRVTLGADASYRSKTYPTVSSSEVVAQDAYTLVDAFVRWERADGVVFAELGAKNLTDERYIDHAFDLSASPGYELAYYGAPSTVRFTLGARF